MTSKLGIVEEEADESMYWLELLKEAGIYQSPELDALHREFDEIVSMIVASSKKIKGTTARSTPE